mmetsp:Transcript_29674/g.78697  ORF Transcript_29674/g.78697 Transcript_29674/m.78697 type:complete len:248 (-) Transcript_29674:70-813(-)
MDFDNESLLTCFLSEEEQKPLVEDWKSNGGRSDIFECRLEKSDELREEGNSLYRKGEPETALQRYFAAVWHLDFDVGQQWNMMENHSLELNQRKLKVISNICAAYMKQKDFVKTKTSADIGLRHMEKAELTDADATAKFFYRKGLANLERGFAEDAYEALKKAEVASPGDRQVRDLLKEASKGQKEDREKAKLVWHNMLRTDEEKACMGKWYEPAVFRARCRVKCRESFLYVWRCKCCERRKKQKKH